MPKPILLSITAIASLPLASIAMAQQRHITMGEMLRYEASHVTKDKISAFATKFRAYSATDFDNNTLKLLKLAAQAAASILIPHYHSAMLRQQHITRAAVALNPMVMSAVMKIGVSTISETSHR